MHRFNIILLNLLFISVFSFGQEDTLLLLNYHTPEEGAMLKWLPASPSVMKEGFEKGYDLYRAEVLNVLGGEKLRPFEKLNDEPIMTWSSNKLIDEVGKDSSVALAGLFIEGQQELNSQDVPANMKEALDRKEEDEMLHFLAVFKAVENNKVAEAIGLFYKDETAQLHEKYMYRIEVHGHPELLGYLLVNDFAEKQSKVAALSASLSRELITLKWFKSPYQNYPFYNIYRSTKKNGGFVKLNDEPYIGQQSEGEKNMQLFNDSIQEYGETYYYQVRGVNSFAYEEGASETVEITANYLLRTSPVISNSETLEEDEIKVDWAIDETESEFISGFNVFRASSGSGKYNRINEKQLSPKLRSFTDNTEKGSSNYYIVTSYGINGDSINSLLHAHLLLDSIPPSKPQILSGICDTLGAVTLTWANNSEPDMEGYRVFRTYYLEKEPERVISGHTPDTTLIDSVDLNEPFTKIYYRIYALDQHFNPSKPSDFFAVDLPDKNPPTNGNFTTYKVSRKGITLNWQPSQAYDLAKMYLLRKGEDSFDFMPVATFAGDSLQITSYTDTSTKSLMRYQYALQSEDSSGLKSSLSSIFVIDQLDKRVMPSVSDLNAIVNKENRMIKLEWQFNANATGFRIYRQKGNGPLETYTYISGTVREFYDKRLKPNSEYTYLIVANLAGGFTSGYSNKVKVKY